MGDIRIVVTVDGHNKTIDKISFKLLEASEAKTCCNTINSLELKDDAWIFARIVNENMYYGLEAFLPMNFSDVILKLCDRDIQKILREVDAQELVKALKGQKSVQERVFSNMSKRAAQMLQEDMTYTGPVRKNEVRKSQEKILAIIHHLDQQGEIVIPSYEEDTVE